MSLECVVCFEALIAKGKEVHGATCGHLLHSNCWREWLQTSPNCPQCRRPTSASQLFKIYFNLVAGDEDSHQRTIDTLQCEIDTLRCDLNCKDADYEKAAKDYEDTSLQLGAAHAEIKTLQEELKACKEKSEVVDKRLLEKCRNEMEILQKFRDQTEELKKTKIELDKARKAERNNESKHDAELRIRKYQGVIEGLKKCTQEFDEMRRCKALVKKLKIYTDDLDATTNIRLDVKKDPEKYVDMFKEVRRFWNSVNKEEERREEDIIRQLKKCPRGCVVHLTGFPPNRKDVSKGVLKGRMEYYGGKVAWVTYTPGDTEAFIRLESGGKAEEKPAEMIVGKLGNQKQLRVKNFTVNAEALEGDEETKFLKWSLEEKEKRTGTKRLPSIDYEIDDGTNEVGMLEYMMSLVALT